MDKQYETEYRVMKSIPKIMENIKADKLVFSAVDFKKFFPLLYDECCGKIYGDFPPNRIKIKIPPFEQKKVIRLSKMDNIEI